MLMEMSMLAVMIYGFYFVGVSAAKSDANRSRRDQKTR